MKNHHKKLKTCCVGIDCSGINILEQVIRENVPMYAYVAIESEKQQFHSFEKKKILIRCDEWPDSETNPDISENILISNTTKKEIKQAISKSKVIFITTSMGTKTGTKGALAVAQVAKHINLPTIAIVTMPFRFEGMKKQQFAEKGIKLLKEMVDLLIIIPHENTELIMPRRSHRAIYMCNSFRSGENIAAKTILELVATIQNTRSQKKQYIVEQLQQNEFLANFYTLYQSSIPVYVYRKEKQ